MNRSGRGGGNAGVQQCSPAIPVRPPRVLRRSPAMPDPANRGRAGSGAEDPLRVCLCRVRGCRHPCQPSVSPSSDWGPPNMPSCSPSFVPCSHGAPAMQLGAGGGSHPRCPGPGNVVGYRVMAACSGRAGGRSHPGLWNSRPAPCHDPGARRRCPRRGSRSRH